MKAPTSSTPTPRAIKRPLRDDRVFFRVLTGAYGVQDAGACGSGVVVDARCAVLPGRLGPWRIEPSEVEASHAVAVAGANAGVLGGNVAGCPGRGLATGRPTY